MRALTLTVLGSLVLGSACSGVEDPLALEEPLVVHQADFKSGKLPGTREASKGKPVVTASELGTAVLSPGAVNVPFIGRASGEAYSVGLRLVDQGTGYWVKPVGAEDPLTPGDLTWELTFDVGEELEPGRQDLAIVAFDEAGRAGQQTLTSVCVSSDLPDEGNVCDPKKEPPAAIAALRWNTDADLDLIVIAPDGTRFSRSNFSQIVDEEVVARLDSDGIAGCLVGRRTESFVWSKKPAKGTWFIYANLFDACQKTAVRFELTTYRKKSKSDGTFSLEEQKSVGGELLRAQSKADAQTPLFLTKIEFP